MDKLIKNIVSTCGDYRKDDGFCFDEKHVKAWIEQFSDESRIPILMEIDNLLQHTYISKDTIYNFFGDVIKYINDNFESNKIEILNCQQKGNSQDELVSLFEDYINMNRIKLGSSKGDKKWLYLDDFIFTGNTAIRDIKELDVQESDIIIAVIATHSKAEFNFERNSKSNVTRYKVFDNYKNERTRKIEVIWPSEFESETLDNHISKIEEQHADDRYETKDDMFRNERVKDMFLADDSRKVLEREFLLHGIELINNAHTSNRSIKPLGYDYKKTLGFGSTLVTFRNCANNCPLVMWYGEVKKPFWGFDDDNPLYKWYPLFPRKTN